MRRGLVIASVSLFLLGIAFAGASYVWLRASYNAPSDRSSESIVYIPRGAGTAAIAATLKQAGVISSSRVFRYGVRIFGGPRPLRAGEYLMPAGASPSDIAAILQSAEQVVHKVTIAEGLTSAEVVSLLAAEPALVGDVPLPREGSLLPETYHFHRNDTRAGLLRRMEDAMQAALDALWDQRQEGLPYRSPGEAVVMASIVEKETGVAGERSRVAAVFINRLRRGMRLQSDPTVVYGISEGSGPLGRKLTRQDLDTATRYNTYQIDGLPPTPIANPGRAALEAVFHPAATKDLYFVADGSGGHAFSETLEQHNRNVRAWRKLQRQN